MNWGCIYTSTLVVIVSDFKLCCRILNIYTELKMQLSIFTSWLRHKINPHLICEHRSCHTKTAAADL